MKKNTLLLFVAAIILSCQQQNHDYSKELKPIVDSFIEVWNNGNYDKLVTIIDPECVRSVNQLPDVNSIEGIKEVMIGFRTAYPDLVITIEDEIYTKNIATIRWTVDGTNTGSGEMPATGKAIKVWGITILHFSNGKLIKEIVAYDNQSLMEQLGYDMTPPTS